MLAQDRGVRASYVFDVLDRAGDPDVLRQIWMMRQPAKVRVSFIRDVLEPAVGG